MPDSERVNGAADVGSLFRQGLNGQRYLIITARLADGTLVAKSAGKFRHGKWEPPKRPLRIVLRPMLPHKGLYVSPKGSPYYHTKVVVPVH